MSDKNDGGPAFPEPPLEHDHYWHPGTQGMSLRDWFAGQALAGLLANSGGPIQANGMSGWGLCNCKEGDVVGYVFHLADAMLAERVQQ